MSETDNKKYTSEMIPITGLATLEFYKYVEQYKSKILECKNNNESLFGMTELSDGDRRRIEIQEGILVAKMNLLIDLFKQKSTSQQTMAFMFEDVKKTYDKLEVFQLNAMHKIKKAREKDEEKEVEEDKEYKLRREKDLVNKILKSGK